MYTLARRSGTPRKSRSIQRSFQSPKVVVPALSSTRLVSRCIGTNEYSSFLQEWSQLGAETVRITVDITIAERQVFEELREQVNDIS